MGEILFHINGDHRSLDRTFQPFARHTNEATGAVPTIPYTSPIRFIYSGINVSSLSECTEISGLKFELTSKYSKLKGFKKFYDLIIKYTSWMFIIHAKLKFGNETGQNLKVLKNSFFILKKEEKKL